MPKLVKIRNRYLGHMVIGVAGILGLQGSSGQEQFSCNHRKDVAQVYAGRDCPELNA